MKLKLFFIAFIFTATIFSQGIAVQGIARDNEDSAIANKSLEFMFTLVKANSTVYSETKNIRTDNFGVFSHIIGNGAAVEDQTFLGIDFSGETLVLKISVTVGVNKFEFFNKPLNSTPYAYHAKNADVANLAINAKNAEVAEFANSATSAITASTASIALVANSAANGVPTGAIMPFVGKEAPTGWLLCDGSDIPSQYTALISALENATKLPDLRGRVLEGTGRSASNFFYVGPPLNDTHNDSNKGHRHEAGTLKGKTTDNGKHRHTTPVQVDFGFGKDDDPKDKVYGEFNTPDQDDVKLYSTRDGEHEHDVSLDDGFTQAQGGLEVRVASYGVNYIIKI
jgi:hypothetical protein